LVSPWARTERHTSTWGGTGGSASGSPSSVSPRPELATMHPLPRGTMGYYWAYYALTLFAAYAVHNPLVCGVALVLYLAHTLLTGV